MYENFTNGQAAVVEFIQFTNRKLMFPARLHVAVETTRNNVGIHLSLARCFPRRLNPHPPRSYIRGYAGHLNTAKQYSHSIIPSGTDFQFRTFNLDSSVSRMMHNRPVTRGCKYEHCPSLTEEKIHHNPSLLLKFVALKIWFAMLKFGLLFI